ncbi:hypothetical protein D3C81_1632510 [compost metagenome]
MSLVKRITAPVSGKVPRYASASEMLVPVTCAVEGLPALRVAVSVSGLPCRVNTWPATTALASSPSARFRLTSKSTPRSEIILPPSVLTSNLPLPAVSLVMSLPAASFTLYSVALVKVTVYGWPAANWLL